MIVEGNNKMNIPKQDFIRKKVGRNFSEIFPTHTLNEKSIGGVFLKFQGALKKQPILLRTSMYLLTNTTTWSLFLKQVIDLKRLKPKKVIFGIVALKPKTEQFK